MSRQVHHLEQGSPEWHAHRATPGQINGSEIAAIMGLSSYVSRAELIRRKATGIEPEYDAATLKRFADGHANEALARPWAEAIIDDDLSPLVMTDTIDGVLISVSLDGITQGYDTTFEHKSLNITLADALDAGVLPDEYHPQCEAGLMVSGATRCLFMASKDGDGSTARHYWYESRPELRPKIIAACKQFLEDVKNHVHVDTATPVVAAPIEALPALAVTVTGSISLVHNLERFGQRLTAFVGGLNSKPETDQDFADLDAAVKVLKEAETALDAAESNALAQTTTIADMCNLVAMYRKVARDNRILFDKIVKQEKENRKAEIVVSAKTEFDAHLQKLNARIGGNWMPPMNGLRFADAIKGLKKLDAMRDKVAGALANAKIEANEIADLIEANRRLLEPLGETASDMHLFPDFGQVCTKAREDFAALLFQRRQESEKRREAERERIRQEEAAKLAAEAKRAEEAKAPAPEMASGIVIPPIDTVFTSSVANATTGPATIARSIAPEEKRTAEVNQISHEGKMVVQSDETIIDDFLKCRSISPADKKALRVHLVAWETYRVKREMAAAA